MKTKLIPTPTSNRAFRPLDLVIAKGETMSVYLLLAPDTKYSDCWSYLYLDVDAPPILGLLSGRFSQEVYELYQGVVELRN